MADKQIGNVMGITDAQDNNFDDDDMDTITAMRSRLQTISATTYSDAELNKMTYNDLVYALRVNDAPTSINS